MSLEQVVSNIDTQIEALDEKLAQCRAQLASCDQSRQLFLEREIEALANTRAKLIKSRTLAIKAHDLRQQLTQPTPSATPKPRLGRILLILLVAALAATATLLLT